jgi:DNA-binding transcriptional regulator YhcF (GntR family)
VTNETAEDAAGQGPSGDGASEAHPVGWRRSPTSSVVQFAVDPHAEHPPFEQLKSRVIGGIASGELIAGTKLPTVRALATELGIAPNTVARAYRELEADGLIETRGRNGTVIKAAADDPAALAQLAAQEYAARVRELGVGSGAAVEYVRTALGGPKVVE